MSIPFIAPFEFISRAQYESGKRARLQRTSLIADGVVKLALRYGGTGYENDPMMGDFYINSVTREGLYVVEGLTIAETDGFTAKSRELVVDEKSFVVEQDTPHPIGYFMLLPEHEANAELREIAIKN